MSDPKPYTVTGIDWARPGSERTVTTITYEPHGDVPALGPQDIGRIVTIKDVRMRIEGVDVEHHPERPLPLVRLTLGPAEIETVPYAATEEELRRVAYRGLERALVAAKPLVETEEERDAREHAMEYDS